MLGETKKFNVTAWIFTMKSRFGWRDRNDVHVEAKTTSEMTVELESLEQKGEWEYFKELSAMSDDDLKELSRR